ncbi:hypothetical protein [Nocardia transvalensis]|uniref:hypothetical protein n=1 Tax=Nocardia transvalensis TaxID=37333 RepID=UPI0018941EC1|nr:hypothetical protein [Nocardia transvalensis]MBF6329553.1 hypothetical protein [Nocardia transvalensis]
MRAHILAGAVAASGLGILSGTAVSASPVAAATVDPAAYRQDDGYFFTTPDGEIGCGIRDTPQGDPPATAGCQRLGIAERDRTGCPTARLGAPSRAAMVFTDGQTRLVCAPEGTFTAATPDHTLPYETSLTVTNFTCTSRPSAVLCVDDTTGHGFQFASGTNLRW